jgi:hypothetical protein
MLICLHEDGRWTRGSRTPLCLTMGPASHYAIDPGSHARMLVLSGGPPCGVT